ncbi:hypothetical protein [Rickettsia endosymbiont of Oedothorax gibbosus]|uniref:hypothetical protein n=1 Tax=Rickettsia endosymbiont of Oedothorax gibbosus TaxID=931099 RepID=UPI0020254BAF|nr:hypothetical protein [Rickettsia endosymbiont of Oedothorax gibbosus]
MSIQEIVKKIKGFLIPAQLKKLAKEQKMIIRERKITAESIVQATLLASVNSIIKFFAELINSRLFEGNLNISEYSTLQF